MLGGSALGELALGEEPGPGSSSSGSFPATGYDDMRRLHQSTSVIVVLKVVLSSDHISPATGKTVAIVISKNGGAFGNPNAGATNATEISNGWYKVTLDATDTNTLGDLIVRGTATLCDDSE